MILSVYLIILIKVDSVQSVSNLITVSQIWAWHWFKHFDADYENQMFLCKNSVSVCCPCRCWSGRPPSGRATVRWRAPPSTVWPWTQSSASWWPSATRTWWSCGRETSPAEPPEGVEVSRHSSKVYQMYWAGQRSVSTSPLTFFVVLFFLNMKINGI